MRFFILFISLLFFGFNLRSQEHPGYAGIKDTIHVDSREEAIELTFGLLPKGHYPSGYLLNKTSFPVKFYFANGTLNDSSFNMLEWYFLENAVRASYHRPDSIIGYDKLDSIKNAFIETEEILP
jgi:hypothetical protein